MTIFNQIKSKDNSLIKKIVKLAKDSRFRDQEQLGVIYGEHLIIEAIINNLAVDILVHETAIDRFAAILAKHQENNIHMLTNELMAKINILESTVEIVATIRMKPVHALTEIYNQDCLVLERIQDPGNLGTILRAARASGVNNVVLSRGSVDVYNPKVLRASQGIQFGLNIYPDIDLPEFLANYGGQVLALTPHSQLSLYAQNLQLTTALVLGNEGEGLSPDLLTKLKCQVSIPMGGNSESLNLAMAATIGLFEMSRQRLSEA